MRLAVLHTNVIVSAGINPDGPAAKLAFDWVLEGVVHIVTCPAIVNEYRQVMRRSKFASDDVPPPWVEFLIEENMRLPDPPPWRHAGQNPDDFVFLALASVTGAWLVTGNPGHFPTGVRGDTVVVSPAGYRRHLLRTASTSEAH